MIRSSVTVILAASLIAVCVIAPAAAKKPCPAGAARLSSGACADPHLSLLMRQRGVLFTQLKISQTALPIGPQMDHLLPRTQLFNVFELGQSGNFSTNPFPRSP